LASFSAISLSLSRAARSALPNSFVCACPCVPMRPNRTVTLAALWAISQNFRELPPMY
jgi:hypothetical protein